MASNSLIALVVDGTGLKDRFARTDNVLDRPERLIDVSHCLGKAYQEIGKLEGALERRADATLEKFSLEEKELCRRTFLRLTQPGEGTEDTKRRASMQELLSLFGKSTAEEEIIQKLADASLLTTEGDLTHKDAFVEVAHEALIRSWPQLRKWIDADRTGLRTRTRLTEAARDWKDAGRDPAYLYTGARLALQRNGRLRIPAS